MNTNAFFANKNMLSGQLLFEKSEASGIYLPAKPVFTPSPICTADARPLSADTPPYAQKFIVIGGSLS